jgi:hypothetical protein
MFMKGYGVQVHARGVELRLDRVPRKVDRDGQVVPIKYLRGTRGDRGAIRAFTEASQRRFEYQLANVRAEFRCMATLTYHARCESWEGEEERNRRIVERSKRDLNRFLSCVRRAIGRYAWVQEFQARGVVHYHVLSENPVAQGRASFLWCRATGEADDSAAMRYAVKVEAVESRIGARSYLGRYIGKGRQKSLPNGIDGAGRWWGMSRGLELALVEEVVTRPEGAEAVSRREVLIARSFRRWLRKRLRFKVRGGAFVDWGSRIVRGALDVLEELRDFYRGDESQEGGAR